MADGAARATWDAWQRLPTARRSERVVAVRFVHLPADVPPWTSTGIDVRAGDWVTLLASGRLVLAAALDIWLPPRVALWARVAGRGPILNGTRDTTSFRAVHDGMLELALCNGEWATPDGVLATPVEAYAMGAGGVDVVVIRWRGEAAEGLRDVARALPGDPLVASERRRLTHGTPAPAGWRHLWFLGPTECFREAVADGRPAIAIDAANDVGILQKPVDVALGPATTLAWRWRVDELPAVGAEDAMPAHDYTSIALEFDDGQDLTWYWSASLPVDAHYRCPLPSWAARETHWVLRTGLEDLGRWYAERRVVADDYRAAIGAPPARIVAVWLIAVSVFGHRRARATYADLVLRDGDRELRIV